MEGSGQMAPAEAGRDMTGQGSARGYSNSGGHTSMISRVRQLAPHVHLPLRHLALCLDCDECFKIGAEPCPACGSRTWVSLSRFMGQASSSRRPRRLDGSPSAAQRHDDHPAMVRQVIIVAGHRAHLYDHIKRAFAGNETVRVLLNRRIGERALDM